MKSKFNHYYKKSDKEYKDLWDKATFILDTGILLNLYKLPEVAKNDLLQILKKVQERLWVPFQVALEFQENRLNVIAQRKKMYGRVKDAIEKVSREQSIKKLDNIIKKFKDDLKEEEEKEKDVHDDDKLREEIDSLFEGRVGDPPSEQKELDDIYKEGEQRYSLLRPPGFEDASKKNDKGKKAYFYNNMVFKREYGDLIIWKQIIEKAKRDGLKYILFITDDEKEDWWERVAEKTIGPRRELIDEIVSVAKVSSFQMYNSVEFMKYAAKHLGVKLAKDSIAQVEEATRVVYEPPSTYTRYVRVPTQYGIIGPARIGTTLISPSGYVETDDEMTPVFEYSPAISGITDVSGKSTSRPTGETLVGDIEESKKDKDK